MRNRAYETAGFREKFAMKHGKRTVERDHRGHTMWTYRYSTEMVQHMMQLKGGGLSEALQREFKAVSATDFRQ